MNQNMHTLAQEKKTSPQLPRGTHQGGTRNSPSKGRRSDCQVAAVWRKLPALSLAELHLHPFEFWLWSSLVGGLSSPSNKRTSGAHRCQLESGGLELLFISFWPVSAPRLGSARTLIFWNMEGGDHTCHSPSYHLGHLGTSPGHSSWTGICQEECSPD